MELYFSGIAGKIEYRMLESAGVERLLVDQFDLEHIPPERAHVALDSGAYRAFKRHLKLDLDNARWISPVLNNAGLRGRAGRGAAILLGYRSPRGSRG